MGLLRRGESRRHASEKPEDLVTSDCSTMASGADEKGLSFTETFTRLYLEVKDHDKRFGTLQRGEIEDIRRAANSLRLITDLAGVIMKLKKQQLADKQELKELRDQQKVDKMELAELKKSFRKLFQASSCSKV